MRGIEAHWLRLWAVNQETMGSNRAETKFIFYFLFFVVDISTHSANAEYCFSPKCVATVATIFPIDRIETLDFRFDVLIVLLVVTQCKLLCR